MTLKRFYKVERYTTKDDTEKSRVEYVRLNFAFGFARDRLTT